MLYMKGEQYETVVLFQILRHWRNFVSKYKRCNQNLLYKQLSRQRTKNRMHLRDGEGQTKMQH
ncbi:hypothetical protein JHK87_014254 [Glycine soja]|nr:hypothetical protein JHK87_014254 [Glycine soja]